MYTLLNKIMGNSNSSNRVTSHDRAILDMKIQRDKLRQYQKKLQTIQNREHEIAKECLARGDKNRALLALRKRKYQEQTLIKTDKHLETLENLTNTIEFSLIQKDVMYGLEQGNAVLKELNREMSLEKVEKLMGETSEAVAYQKEVSELLGSNLNNDDEDEVEDELAAMQQEAEAEHLKNNPEAAPLYPKVPDNPLDEESAQDKEAKRKEARKRRLEGLQAIPA